jgi:hypothetical protein
VTRPNVPVGYFEVAFVATRSRGVLLRAVSTRGALALIS